MDNEPQFQDSDLLEIVDDEADTARETSLDPWRVLIVDDDEDVHRATDLALAEEIVFGRPLELIHARSGQEALRMMSMHGDVAAAFIDVVMETPDAGLKLVRSLREQGYKELRAILRTGQPGYAPDRVIVEQYEIDGYHTKSELTRSRLVTVLTSAIRGYTQIQALSRSRSGLEMIVESSTELFRRTNLRLFSTGVLTQIAALLGLRANGFVCIDSTDNAEIEDAVLLTAAGHFAEAIGKAVSQLNEAGVLDLLRQAECHGNPTQGGGFMALRIAGESGRRLWVVL
ncbi:MAG: DUF3369 domain-containing protein, partial [Thalassobaculaceae bacterium]|nr:DUF3369 domain-containing protein [Thalassobaculaceae bacterium]